VWYRTLVARTYDDALIIVFQGDLDVYQTGPVRKQLIEASRSPRVIFDLTAVSTISAAVLSEFVVCYKVRQGRGFKPASLVVSSPHVRRIFEITNLAKLWPMFETLDAAKGAIPA
jgi:anti-anti-sigma factor